MADINSTNINDLPTDPIGGGSIGGNISMVAQESGQQNASINTNSNSGQMSLDQSTISQIVNGLQQASMYGATSLPSRDIPMNTDNIVKDEQVQPNYIPPPSTKDYIHETDDDINNYMRKEKIDNSLDALYDEFQTPLLLAVLYFIFQLPIFKKVLYQYIPFLFFKDGNYNINGLIFTSGLFAFIYYSVSKSVKHFSRF